MPKSSSPAFVAVTENHSLHHGTVSCGEVEISAGSARDGAESGYRSIGRLGDEVVATQILQIAREESEVDKHTNKTYVCPGRRHIHIYGKLIEALAQLILPLSLLLHCFTLLL